MLNERTHHALTPIQLTRRIVVVFGLSATIILCLGYTLTREWFSNVHTPAFEALSPMLGMALVVVCGLTAANVGLRWLRWHLILRRLGMMLPARESALLYVGTLPALVTPLRIGELVRVVALGRRYPRFRADAVAVWLLERSTDLVVLVVFAGLSFHHVFVWSAVGIWLISVLLIRAVYRRRHDEQVMKLSTIGIVLLVTTIGWVLPVIALVLLMRLLDSPISSVVGLQAFAHSTVFGNITGLPGGVLMTGSTLIGHLQQADVDLDMAILGGFLFRLGTIWFSVAIGVATCIAGRRMLKRMVTSMPAADHFEDIAHGYAEELPEHLKARLLDRKVQCMERHLPPATTATGDNGALRGLDMGCGHAWYSTRMAAKGYRMTGVDVSAAQIENAQRYVSEHGMAVDCQTIQPGVLPFPDNHFDFAYAINVFHHILDEDLRRQTWDELIRVLKPGGVFFLHEINVTNPLFRLYAGYIYPLIRAIDEGTERWIEPGDLPAIQGADWQANKDYFTFLPDFAPAWMLHRGAPLESRLEASRWKTWSAHYMARLVKAAPPTA